MTELRAQAILARQAALELSTVSAGQKNDALFAMARELRAGIDGIVCANEQDVREAQGRE